MTRGLALAAVGVVAAGGALAAAVALNSSPDTSRTVASSASLDEQCGSAPAGAKRLVVEAVDGFTLGAATVTAEPDAAASETSGTVVVLRHGASQTLCDWLNWADVTAHHTGATVLLMD